MKATACVCLIHKVVRVIAPTSLLVTFVRACGTQLSEFS